MKLDIEKFEGKINQDENRYMSEEAELNMRELEIAAQGFLYIQKMVRQTEIDNGWDLDPSTGLPIVHNTGERLMLMVSEIAEAMEADRKNLMDDHLPHRSGLEVELGDAVIRIMTFAAKNNLDLIGAIIEKDQFNKVRLDHKLSNRANNGKKY